MTWPSGAVVTTNVDATTDDPELAVVQIKDSFDKLNQIIAHVSSFIQGLLDDADATAARTTLGAAPVASPTFTGTPAAPTASPGDNTTQLATTGFVKAAIDVVLGGVSSAFDTLSEIATELGLKAPLVSPTFTGTPLEAMGSGSGTAALIGKAHINTTAVGNVGTGAQDLMSYSVPANALSAVGKGLRITIWGSTLNNANAKLLTISWGSSAFTIFLSTGIQSRWKGVLMVFETGTNTQDMVFEFTESTAGLSATDKSMIDISAAGSETTSGAIVTKCRATGTTNDDIRQEGLLVEYIG